MKSSKKKDKSYIYSKFSGFYVYDLCETRGEQMLLRDIRQGVPTEYLAKVIYSADDPIAPEKALWYSNIIRFPVISKYFEWPVDLIETFKDGETLGALVYERASKKDMLPLKELLYQPSMSEVLDWRNEFIIKLCANFADAMTVLHSRGYIYSDFDINSVLYDPKTADIYFKFNTNIRRIAEVSEYDVIDCEDVATEFAPPYIYSSDVYSGYMTPESDCYQISAILFRLMIGRLPYEGRDLMNYGAVFDPVFDTDENAHEYFFKHYHQYPHFVFDENDETNALSLSSENNLPRERWEQLPADVKAMFRAVLCQRAAECPSESGIPTLAEWSRAISRLAEIK